MNWHERYNRLMKLGPSDATWAAKVAEAEKEIEFSNKAFRATAFEEPDLDDVDWDKPRRMVVPRGYLMIDSRAVIAVEARIAQLEQQLAWAQSDAKALRDIVIRERGRL